MADNSGIAVVSGVLLATGIIVVLAKPEIVTNLFNKGGGVGSGPGTSPPSGEPNPEPGVPPATTTMGKLPTSMVPMERLPTPEQDQLRKRKRNDPGLDIRIMPGSTVYQSSYFKVIAAGFEPYEHVNFYFTSRELLATGRYKFNTITTGGEIQHAVDKADGQGNAEVKMIAPSSVGGPADIVAVGIESGLQINTTMYIMATNKPRPIKRFRMSAGGDRFYVIATDPHVVRGLVDMYQGRQSLAHIHGKVGFGPGKGGFNRPWNWHLVPTSINLSSDSATTCNVRPSMIQRDPGEYIRRNGFFCPMTARVEAVEYA